MSQKLVSASKAHKLQMTQNHHVITQRDYATKHEGDPSMLAEGYGLKRNV